MQIFHSQATLSGTSSVIKQRWCLCQSGSILPTIIEVEIYLDGAYAAQKERFTAKDGGIGCVLMGLAVTDSEADRYRPAHSTTPLEIIPPQTE